MIFKIYFFIFFLFFFCGHWVLFLAILFRSAADRHRRLVSKQYIGFSIWQMCLLLPLQVGTSEGGEAYGHVAWGGCALVTC